MKKTNRQKIINIVGNNIFHVAFIKKNGDTKEMTCRLNVTAHCGEGKQTADEDKYLVVYDMSRKKFNVSKEDKRHFYRNVNMDTIQYIRVNGSTHKL